MLSEAPPLQAARSGGRRRCRAPACSAAAAAVADVPHTLNPRVASLRESKTMVLTDLARAMKEEGKPAGVAALRGGFTRYTANAGTAELRAAVCAKLRSENGLDYMPSQVVVSNGAKQSIAQVVQALCGPGDEVLIPAPYWVSYPEMARLAGATPVVLPTSPEDGFLLSPAALAAALTPASRLLILCSPSNPTGAVYPREALAALADVVASHPRLMVLSDEIYEHIIYPPATHASFAALPGMWSRTATVNGFSKAFAMTGWRLGYAAAPTWVASACASIQAQTTSGASSVAQKAGVAALGLGRAGGAPVAAMVQAFRRRRDYVASRVAAWPGARMRCPEGAFYAMPALPGYHGPGVAAPGFGPVPTTDHLCRYLLQAANVALVPGEAFGAPGTARLSYAASDEDLKEACDRLEAALGAITRDAQPA